MSLKKFSKTNLISLINNYESDIADLQYQLQELLSIKEVVKKEFIVIDKDDDKTINYIKKRIQCCNCEVRKNQYSNELERLLSYISV
tara:strand:- start:358 stop:618 length:261 start_codon:yes stop_codon:yes gene_type:complete